MKRSLRRPSRLDNRQTAACACGSNPAHSRQAVAAEWIPGVGDHSLAFSTKTWIDKIQRLPQECLKKQLAVSRHPENSTTKSEPSSPPGVGKKFERPQGFR